MRWKREEIKSRSIIRNPPELWDSVHLLSGLLCACLCVVGLHRLCAKLGLSRGVYAWVCICVRFLAERVFIIQRVSTCPLLISVLQVSPNFIWVDFKVESPDCQISLCISIEWKDRKKSLIIRVKHDLSLTGFDLSVWTRASTSCWLEISTFWLKVYWAKFMALTHFHSTFYPCAVYYLRITVHLKYWKIVV